MDAMLMFYHWMFNLARWIALWSPAQGHVRPAEGTDLPGETMDVATLHCNNRQGNALQGLGHPQHRPTTVRSSRGATRRVAKGRRTSG